MERPQRVAAVVLAAGEARRFGSLKQLARLHGRTLLEHVLDLARRAGLDPIIAVVPPDLAVDRADVVRVANAQPELGMSHSMRLGFAALPPDVEAALILLGDQPTVQPQLLRRLLTSRGATPFVATRAAGRLAPPVLVERSHFATVQEPVGDIGLREILQAQLGLVTPIDVEELPVDVDTVADLEAIGGR